MKTKYVLEHACWLITVKLACRQHRRTSKSCWCLLVFHMEPDSQRYRGQDVAREAFLEVILKGPEMRHALKRKESCA